MTNTCAVILAAGEGKRMRSNKSKVLLEVQLKPMLGWVTDAIRKSGIEDLCVVTGHRREQVEEYLAGSCETVVQTERKGTGHAVMMAREFLERHHGGHVLICCGDAPFLDSETISDAFAQHNENGASATVISAVLDDPTGYGRLIRGNRGELEAIVEHKEATPDQLAIQEINSGAYWFEIDPLLEVLDSIKASSVTGEYYLPDAVKLLIGAGKSVGAFIAQSDDVVLGANDPAQLFELNRLARDKILSRHISNGVAMPCIDGIVISNDVVIGENVTILPGTVLKGKTVIGDGCRIGPTSYIDDCEVGENCLISLSQIRESRILENTDIGPFSDVRPGSQIGPDVHVGNYVEIKNSTVAAGTKIAHHTYIGDSTIGENVNFGCGCVTANYDGVNKNRCVIGDNAFIGSNVNLIAPVEIGAGAYVAAGSTITENVPDDSLSIARDRQTNKLGWVSAQKNK